jgi:hypothetical protein
LREKGVGTSITAVTTDYVTESRANVIAGNVMLGCYLVAIVAVASYLVVILIRLKREKDAAAPVVVVDSNVLETAGVDCLNADGSGGVGNLSKTDGGVEWASKEEEEDGAVESKLV